MYVLALLVEPLQHISTRLQLRSPDNIVLGTHIYILSINKNKLRLQKNSDQQQLVY